jgi:hypothetical protein
MEKTSATERFDNAFQINEAQASLAVADENIWLLGCLRAIQSSYSLTDVPSDVLSSLLYSEVVCWLSFGSLIGRFATPLK